MKMNVLTCWHQVSFIILKKFSFWIGNTIWSIAPINTSILISFWFCSKWQFSNAFRWDFNISYMLIEIGYMFNAIKSNVIWYPVTLAMNSSFAFMDRKILVIKVDRWGIWKKTYLVPYVTNVSFKAKTT